jgi:hypothetical protein
VYCVSEICFNATSVAASVQVPRYTFPNDPKNIHLFTQIQMLDLPLPRILLMSTSVISGTNSATEDLESSDMDDVLRLLISGSPNQLFDFEGGGPDAGGLDDELERELRDGSDVDLTFFVAAATDLCCDALFPFR